MVSAATDVAGRPMRATAVARARFTAPPLADAPAAFGTPVAFGSTLGFLYPGTAPLAVLMVGAVGYEEMCLRTTWRALAEAISDAGVACLRFDLPSVGDAIAPENPTGLDDWRRAIAEAASFLREATGRDRIAIVGQGVGGALAGLMAPALGAVDGVAFMAPVTNGRLYLRELALWGAMLTDVIGVGPDPDQRGGCVVGGVAIEDGRLPALKALDLQALALAPAAKALVVGRANHGGDERFAARLDALGVGVDRLDYEGYATLATDPTQARPPLPLLRKVAAWLAGLAPARGGPAKPARVACEGFIQGDGFRETPLRFGEDGRLFGVLCEPEAPRASGPALVLANAGRDYHIGWGRATIDQARAFAQLGLASIRFDAAGLGDSPPPAGPIGEVLYSDRQVDDTRAAAAELNRMGYQRIGLVGRCSGAYAVFHAAVADPNVTDLVMINTERFVWDPREDVEEALRYAHRTLGDFGATFWKRNGFVRLFRGELRVAPAVRYVAQRMRRTTAVRLAPLLGELTEEAKLYRAVHRRFADLSKRGVNVWIVYSEGDLGLIELDAHFGRGGKRLALYPNVRRAMVADSDHNFTHKGARERLLATLTRVFLG